MTDSAWSSWRPGPVFAGRFGKCSAPRRSLPALLAAAMIPALLGAACARPGAATSPAPPNSPGQVELRGDRLTLEYGGRTVFDGVIEFRPAGTEVKVSAARAGEKIERFVLLVNGASREAVRLRGTVFGSGEAFPCEADRPVRGPRLVRHSDGLGLSLLNRAVYDRREDWVLSVDANPRVRVAPVEDGPSGRTFSLEAEGTEIVLRFRPRYYQLHRGLRFYEPWTYRPRPAPAGWISWFAFYDRVTEEDILRTAAVMSATLKPFGYDLLQIDDGYQRGTGPPELWLQANAKFPRGLGFLAASIKKRGLVPGIWTNAAFTREDFVAAHPDWFVRGPDGRPARGNWIGFPLDASNETAVREVVRPIYRGLRDMGWEYFKLDALRHLRYEGYNAHRDHFAAAGADPVEAFRSYVRAVREEIGDVFLLGCWGIRPELIGLIDGCRIGTDGFSYAGLAQFNSFNNVVWRNDPDHIEILKDGPRSATVTTLTGSLLLLTDKPEVYRTDAVEPARRAAPVPRTAPGQIYDVDPSRVEALDRVDAEVSGSGPRVFDAGLSPACDLYLLEIHRPFESWAVLGRTGESVPEIALADLGLGAGKDYLVFEFWTKSFRGVRRGTFAPGPIEPGFKVQAFCLRERLDRPQVAATGRHVTCGGVDLVGMSWADGSLSGTSRIVAGDPYDLYLTEPEGYRAGIPACTGATVASVTREGGLVRVRLVSKSGGEAAWSVPFTAPAGTAATEIMAGGRR